MKVGLTYDLRTDYGIEENSMVFADFCHPDEIGYMEEAIKRNGYDTLMIGNMYKLNERIIKGTLDCDIVLVCDEGIASRNREAIVPALLELNKIPYIGSDAYCMGLSQNKYHTKLVAQALGIRFPKGIYIEWSEAPDMDAARAMLAEKGLAYPLIVKPNEEGYSMGVFLVRNDEELQNALQSDFDNYHEPVLVEEFIEGKELYVPIIGTGQDAFAMAVGAVYDEHGSDLEFFCVEDKCLGGVQDVVLDLPEPVKNRMFEDALKLYRHMECKDFGRCDFRMTKDGEPVMIEITPRPGFTEKGPFETCAKALGKSYDWVLKEIINGAAKRYGIKE